MVAFSVPASALAATNPGIKPGNFFYFFDTAFEQINLFFTFSPEKKVEKALVYADERLAEAEAVAGDNNVEAVKTAITNYESNIALAAEKSKEVQDKEKAESLFTLIADNTSKNQEVLSAVLIKVPEEAKEAITRAIEASRKGQEEATQQITELKSEIEQLKKEVAKFKEGKVEIDNSNQFSEIGKLKREIEELKNTRATSPVVEVKSKTQPKTTTDGSSSQQQNYDQELSQLIVETRQRISTFEGAIRETEEFAPLVRTTMNKYPNEFIMQQSGQELLNENSNLASISRKLVMVETERTNKLSSHLGLDILPKIEDFSQITQQYNNYYQQYEASNTKIELLIKNLVLNEKSVLERLTQQTRQQIQDMKTQYYETPSQSSPDSRLEYAFSELRSTLSNISNEQISSVVMGRKKEKAAQDWMQQNSNVFSYPSYIAQFNSILSAYGLYYMVIPQ